MAMPLDLVRGDYVDSPVDTTPKFDAAGNMVNDGRAWVFTYNARNQLVGASRRNQDGTVGTLFAKLTYNALGWRTSAVYDDNANGSLDDETAELYCYDEHWRLTAVYRQGPVVPSTGQRPEPRLYERYIYHTEPFAGQGLKGPVIDSLVMRERDADGNPATGPSGLEERLWYIQNARGDVVGLVKTIPGPSGNTDIQAADRLGYSVERVRYTPYGEPSCYAAADVNLDGKVDTADQTAFMINYIAGTPDRRIDINGNGRLDPEGGTGPNAWPGADGPLFATEYTATNGFDGNDKLSRPDIDNRFGYAGYTWDRRLGLYHVRNRVYDPKFGRWLQRDPIGYAGGWNLYQSCGGKPNGWIDPSGRIPDSEYSNDRWRERIRQSQGWDTEHTRGGAKGQLSDLQLGVRLLGGLRTGVGAMLIAGGGSLALFGGWSGFAIPLGAVIVAVGADQVGGGVRTVINGEESPTIPQIVGSVTATALGANSEDVTAIGNAVDSVVITASSLWAAYGLMLREAEAIAAAEGAAAGSGLREVGGEPPTARRPSCGGAGETGALDGGAIKGEGGGIPTIGGRRPINSGYAGDVHPSGVRFTERGFPDFSPYSMARVELEGLTGNYAKDAAMANKAVGLSETPSGFVWHHVEDGRSMQLIPQEIHNAVRHTGGAAVIRNGGYDR